MNEPTTAPFVLFSANRPIVEGHGGTPTAPEGPPLVLTLVGTVLLAIAVAVLSDAVFEWTVWHFLRAGGATAEGRVLRLRVDRDAESGSTFHVAYRFKVATPEGPRAWEREEEIPAAFYRELRREGPIRVLYDAGEPSRARADRPSGGEISSSSLGACVIAGLGAWLVARAVRLTRRFREGTVLTGYVVTADGVDDSETEGGYLVTLDYRFLAPSGERLTGRTRGACPEAKRVGLPTPGTPVFVLFAGPRNHQVL